MAGGEIIQAESGAMVSMTEGVDMQTSTKGGMLKGLKRAALGGESMFINTFTAERDAEITMAPAFPGDLRQMRLENETLYLQSGSYMASTGEIDIDTKWAGGNRPSSPGKAWSCISPGRGALSSRPGARTHSPDGWHPCCPRAPTLRARASTSAASSSEGDRTDSSS